MKTKLLLILFFLSAAPAFAYERVNLICEQGGKQLAVTSTIVPGTTNQPKYLDASYPLATATIFPTGSSTPVPRSHIFSDNGVTVAGNPISCDDSGHLFFYVAAGRYDVTFSGAGITTPFSIGDILVCDPIGPNADPACSSGGGGGTTHNLLSTTHLDTIPASPPTRGDIITGQNLTSPSSVTPAWARLALGATNFVLSSNGVDAVWTSDIDISGCALLGPCPINVAKNGTLVGKEPELNLVEGAGITLSPFTDSGGAVNVTIATNGTGPGSGGNSCGYGCSIASNGTKTVVVHATSCLAYTPGIQDVSGVGSNITTGISSCPGTINNFYGSSLGGKVAKLLYGFSTATPPSDYASASLITMTVVASAVIVNNDAQEFYSATSASCVPFDGSSCAGWSLLFVSGASGITTRSGTIFSGSGPPALSQIQGLGILLDTINEANTDSMSIYDVFLTITIPSSTAPCPSQTGCLFSFPTTGLYNDGTTITYTGTGGIVAPLFTASGTGAAILTGTSANTDLAGKLTLSSGTATYTFANGPYTSAPICIVQDDTSFAGLTGKTVSTTTLTVTGGTTDVIDYTCIARN